MNGGRPQFLSVSLLADVKEECLKGVCRCRESW